MSKALNRIIPWIAGAALVVTLTACTGDDGQGPSETPGTASVQPAAPSEAMDQPTSQGSEQAFDGAGMTTETITANSMEIQIPAGLKIPENTLVTEALPASIMMADEDPTAVNDMVTQSAAEAGYEVYAEAAGSKVFVGKGNAVLFTAGPMVQQITWGPEAMKDVLAGTLAE